MTKLDTGRLGPFVRVAAIAGTLATALGVWLLWRQIGMWSFRPTARAITLIAVASPFGLMGLLILAKGDAYLKIDVRAGSARLVQLGKVQWSTPLGAFGALAVRPNGRRFDLVAEGTGTVLFTGADRGVVHERKQLIGGLVAQSAVRAILATTVEGGEFRGAPEIVTQARQAVPDAAMLKAAVAALRDDADADVRTRAEQLGKALERG